MDQDSARRDFRAHLFRTANEAVAVRATPQMSLEPTTPTITATVERHADNRALDIQVVSSDYYRASRVQVNGDEAPRVTTTSYEGVPGGSYEIRTTVLGPGGKPRATASAFVQVLSRFGR